MQLHYKYSIYKYIFISMTMIIWCSLIITISYLIFTTSNGERCYCYPHPNLRLRKVSSVFKVTKLTEQLDLKPDTLVHALLIMHTASKRSKYWNTFLRSYCETVVDTRPNPGAHFSSAPRCLSVGPMDETKRKDIFSEGSTQATTQRRQKTCP